MALIKQELDGYTDVLLGRAPSPLNRGTMTLMELAETYHARAREIEMQLLAAEADGIILRGSKAYRFRTGYLRSFVELSSKSIDLGSRRVTFDQMMRD